MLSKKWYTNYIFLRERLPGLLAKNLIVAHPFLGTPKVFTSGGSFKLYVLGEEVALKFP